MITGSASSLPGLPRESSGVSVSTCCRHGSAAGPLSQRKNGRTVSGLASLLRLPFHRLRELVVARFCNFVRGPAAPHLLGDGTPASRPNKECVATGPGGAAAGPPPRRPPRPSIRWCGADNCRVLLRLPRLRRVGYANATEQSYPPRTSYARLLLAQFLRSADGRVASWLRPPLHGPSASPWPGLLPGRPARRTRSLLAAGRLRSAGGSPLRGSAAAPRARLSACPLSASRPAARSTSQASCRQTNAVTPPAPAPGGNPLSLPGNPPACPPGDHPPAPGFPMNRSSKAGKPGARVVDYVPEVYAISSRGVAVTP